MEKDKPPVIGSNSGCVESPRINEKLFWLWLILFGGLNFAHLEISFRLNQLPTLAHSPTATAPAEWDGQVPLAAKIIIIALLVLLLLICWRKSRKYAKNAALVIFAFAPIAFGICHTMRAGLAKDLATFSESYTQASGALMWSLAPLCCSVIFIKLRKQPFKSVAAKPSAPPLPSAILHPPSSP